MNTRKYASEKLIEEKKFTRTTLNQFPHQTILRQQAEQLLKKKLPNSAFQLSEIDTIKLLHELEVHQIELELQNEELKLAKEKAAELASERYAELYDFSPSGYFTLSREGEIIELNLCGSQMLGRERSNINNAPFAFFIPNNLKPIFNHFLWRVFNNNTKESCEVTIAPAGRLAIDVQLNGIATQNGEKCLLTAVDISERRRADEIIKDSERFLKETQVIAKLGTYTTDITTGRWKSSEILDHIFGIDAHFDKSVDGWVSIVHPEWQSYMSNYFMHEVIGKKTHFDKEYKIIRQNDKEGRWVHGLGNLKFNQDNQPITMVGTIMDITERKQAEEEIKLKNQELQKLNGEKDRYFSIIAHDLRSPFSGFLSLTELMAKGLPQMTQDEIQKITILMRNSAANLFRLLGNLLEWSRMQRGLTTFFPSNFLLRPKISKIMVWVLEGANQKDITISYSIPEDIVVFADGNMFEAIIRNLVSNAVKFTRQGGRITISAKSAADNSVEISVSDSGVGMNKKIIENLFRLDINTNRKGTEGEYSTGLGLTICRDFIEKHGGKLWIESEEKKGSTFSFTLPANPDCDAEN